jgi:hypothetical protein
MSFAYMPAASSRLSQNGISSILCAHMRMLLSAEHFSHTARHANAWNCLRPFLSFISHSSSITGLLFESVEIMIACTLSTFSTGITCSANAPFFQNANSSPMITSPPSPRKFYKQEISRARSMGGASAPAPNK